MQSDNVNACITGFVVLLWWITKPFTLKNKGTLHLVVCYHEVEQFAVICADEEWWQACGAGVTRDYLKAMLHICDKKSSICEWLVIGNQWATYAVREAEVDIYATFDPSLSPGCIAERAQGIVDWVAIEARSLSIVEPIVMDS